MQRWQLALQRELPGNSVIELSYVGNRGVRQQVTRNLNALPDSYLSTSPVRDQATINFLSAQVPNPFYPLLPGTSLSGTTVARSQLLLPFPQFTGINYNTNQGYSYYHAMQTRFEKRFSQGLQSSVSWTWSKLIQATGYLNAGDPMPEKVISDQDRPHRVVVTGIYELPFGPNKRFGAGFHGFAGKLIGGWQISGVVQHQTGQAIAFGNVLFTGDVHDIALPKDQRTVSEWIQRQRRVQQGLRAAARFESPHLQHAVQRHPPGWTKQPGRRAREELHAQGRPAGPVPHRLVQRTESSPVPGPERKSHQQRVRCGYGGVVLAANHSVCHEDPFLACRLRINLETTTAAAVRQGAGLGPCH